MEKAKEFVRYLRKSPQLNDHSRASNLGAILRFLHSPYPMNWPARRILVAEGKEEVSKLNVKNSPAYDCTCGTTIYIIFTT